MKDRFDLELEINEGYNFSSNLNNLASKVGELSEDDLMNALIGLGVLMDCHTEKLHETMCSIFNLNKPTVDDNVLDTYQ
jgi:hypothetical protein